MKQAKFEDLFREELEDLYDAEKQIVEALPKMMKAASSEELTGAFQEHLEQTKEQVKRLEKIFESMGEQPGGRKCEGMQGLLREGERLLTGMERSEVLDAGLIGAAQKVEHYEISAYGTARAMAEMLGQLDIAELLQETLAEEEAADENLSVIAEGILDGDVRGDSDEELEDEEEVESA
jgi:ferritin-like metal-binding protein YciE